MSDSVYDRHSDFYIDFVDRVTETAPYKVSVAALLEALGDLDGKDVCDLACGEGFLSRILASKGARVSGFDCSERLIEVARRRSNEEIRFEVADAQRLDGVGDSCFDVVVSHVAAMDIPDLDAMFSTVKRVVRPSGLFALVILHPCFETPFSSDEAIAEAGPDGQFAACRVMHYRDEGYWSSGGAGVRGKVGAYHRMLSTYLNSLIANGFTLSQFLEPLLPPGNYEEFSDQWSVQIPRRLGIISRA